MERLLSQKLPERQKADMTVQRVEPPPDLSPLRFACRRLLDALASSGRWEDAQSTGVPFTVRSTPEFFNFRQVFFTRQKKHMPAALQYGGQENLQEHGKAAGWRSMLNELAKQKIGSKITNEECCHPFRHMDKFFCFQHRSLFSPLYTCSFLIQN